MAEFSGNFQTINLAEVLRMLAATRQTGVLQCACEGEKGMLMLENGRIVSATTGDQLGPPALYQFILWRDGTFEFVAAPIPASAPRDLEVYDTDEIISGVARKIDELAAMQQAVPDLDSVLMFLGSETLRDVNATPAELGLLILADGRRTVGEIAAKAGMNPLEVARALARFRLAGVLELVEAVVPANPGDSGTAKPPAATTPPPIPPPPAAEENPHEVRYWRGRKIS